MTSRLQYWCKKQCGDWLFSHVKTFFCFKQFAERLTTVVKAIFVFTVKKSSQPLNSLLLEIHVPFLTNLASIFLTFSVTRAIVSSVFRGQDDIEDGLLTCDDVELKCCCGEKRTLLLLFFNVCCCFFQVIFRRSPNFLWDCRDRASTLAGGHLGFKYADSSLVMNIKIYLGGRGWFESSLVMNIKIYLGGQGWFESSLVMNIKINLGGRGWFESSLLVMNIKIYLGGHGWFESSLMMNIKIYLGDRGWFESILAMNIKIFLGDQGWFGRRRFFSSPSSGLHLRKIQGFARKMWTVYTYKYLYFLTFDLSGAVWEPDAFDSVN